MRRALFVWLCWLALAWGAPAATITGTLIAPDGGLYQTNISFRPLSTPYGATSGVVASVLISTNCDTNGSFTVRLLAGTYTVQLGRMPSDRFYITVPDDTNTYTLHSLVTNQVAWTNAIVATTPFSRSLLQAGSADEAKDILQVSGGAATNAVGTILTNGTLVASGAKQLDIITLSNLVITATNAGGGLVKLGFGGQAGGASLNNAHATNLTLWQAGEENFWARWTNDAWTVNGDIVALSAHIVGAVDAANFNGFFYGDGSGLTNLPGGASWTNLYQPGSAVLTNLSATASNNAAILMAATNYAYAASNALQQTKQPASANLTNWSAMATNVIGQAASNGVRVAAGANIAVTTNSSGGVMVYTVSGNAGSGTNALVLTNAVLAGEAGTLNLVAGSNIVLLATNAGGQVSVGIHGSAGGGLAEVWTGTNVLWVSPTGNDTTAERGRLDKPWGTISNAVAAMHNGDAIFLLPGAHYVPSFNETNKEFWDYPINAFLSAPVAISNKHSIALIGVPGASVISQTSTSCLGIVSIYRCTNVVVSGITITSVNDRVYPQNPHNPSAPMPFGCLQLAECARVTIRDCVFGPARDFGVLEHSAGGWTQTNEMVMERCVGRYLGCYVESQSRWDGGLWAGGGWTVRECAAYDCARGFEIYAIGPSNPTLAFDTRLLNNVVCDWTETAYGMGPLMIRALIARNVAVWRTNRLAGSGGNSGSIGVLIKQSTNCVVLDNYIDGCSQGIRVDDSDGTYCRDNVISNVTAAFPTGQCQSETGLAQDLDYDISWTNGVTLGPQNLSSDFQILSTSATNLFIYHDLGISLVVGGNGILELWSGFGPMGDGGFGSLDGSLRAGYVETLLGATLTNATVSGLALPGYGAQSGYVWTATNATTGEGHWAAPPAASATNAIASVWTNGAPLAASGATNLHFIAGTNVVLEATNDSGNVSLRINSAGGAGAFNTNQFSGEGVVSLMDAARATNLISHNSAWLARHESDGNIIAGVLATNDGNTGQLIFWRDGGQASALFDDAGKITTTTYFAGNGEGLTNLAFQVATNGTHAGDARVLNLIAGTNTVLEATNAGDWVNVQINSSSTGGGEALPAVSGPYGCQMLVMNPLTMKPMWAVPVVVEEFVTGSTSYGSSGGAGGGGGFAWNYSNYDIEGASGVSYCTVYGTNGIGGTHYARAHYTATIGGRWRGRTNGCFARCYFLQGTSNIIAQIGYGYNFNDTNHTYCTLWQYHPEFSTNWMVICKGTGGSITWTSNVPANALNTIWGLGFEGSTNAMVFYINGTALWTNTSGATMDQIIRPGFWLFNSATQAVASSKTLCFDKFMVWGR